MNPDIIHPDVRTPALDTIELCNAIPDGMRVTGVEFDEYNARVSVSPLASARKTHIHITIRRKAGRRWYQIVDEISSEDGICRSWPSTILALDELVEYLRQRI